MANNDGTVSLLTAREVANLFRVSRSLIYQWAKDGRIPEPLRLGGSLRWDRAALLAWLADGAPTAMLQAARSA